jgi:hypothetical protein
MLSKPKQTKVCLPICGVRLLAAMDGQKGVDGKVAGSDLVSP